MISLPAVFKRKSGEGTPSISKITCANDTYIGLSVDWHPSSKFIAAGHLPGGGNELSVWAWDGSTLARAAIGAIGGTSALYIKWHPNGNFLAARIGAQYVKIYEWNGVDTLTEVESLSTSPHQTEGLDWHPDGNFLAIGMRAYGDGVKIYGWNGTDTLTYITTTPPDLTYLECMCKWSPNGQYLATGGWFCGSVTRIYEWNGVDTLTFKAKYHPNLYGTNSVSIDWASNNSTIFTSYTTSDWSKTNYLVRALEFSGTSLSFISGAYNFKAPYPGQSGYVNSALSKKGGFLFTSSSNLTYTPYLGAYSWDGAVLTQVDAKADRTTSNYMAISPNNKYLARTAGKPSTFCIYETNLYL